MAPLPKAKEIPTISHRRLVAQCGETTSKRGRARPVPGSLALFCFSLKTYAKAFFAVRNSGRSPTSAGRSPDRLRVHQSPFDHARHGPTNLRFAERFERRLRKQLVLETAELLALIIVLIECVLPFHVGPSA